MSLSLFRPSVLLLATLTGCGSAPDEDPFHLFGAVEGERFVLGPGASERSFRALACRDAPDEAELDLRLAAFADSADPVEIQVSITTPEEERRETFTVESRTRIDLDGLLPVLDAEAACLEGIPIRFELAESATAETGIEWTVHFGFRADEEIVRAEVELVDDPNDG